MSFCLDDGAELLYGPAPLTGPATASLPIPSLQAKTVILNSDSPASTSNSIAVLPFTHMSSDEDNEYFCDGLAEELINALSKIDDLKVAARTSAFSFKGKDTDISAIASKLSVRTVLHGSVRKSRDRLRITVQLINAADGYHLWSERYDREMKDVFDVQDEITTAVVDALKIELLGNERSAVLKHHTRNPEALEFYLRGRSYFAKFTPDYFEKAIKCFEQAIAVDPDYASAYAGLAESFAEMSFFGSQGDWMPRAKAAARKAVELDGSLGNAHTALAVTKMYYDLDFVGAEHDFKHALALDPGSAHIHMWYGWYLGLTRRFDEGLQVMRRAQEVDPISHLIGFGIGAIYLWSGQSEHAIEELGRVVELNPNFPLAYCYLAEAYIDEGAFVSAVSTIDNAKTSLDDPISLSVAAYVYAKAGDRPRALEILSKLQELSEGAPPVQIAQIFVGLGDHEQALAWVERACDERSVWLIWLGVDTTFGPLRGDLRFEKLMKGMNVI